MTSTVNGNEIARNAIEARLRELVKLQRWLKASRRRFRPSALKKWREASQ